jgi:endonuclease YncB( thermonuclease family)
MPILEETVRIEVKKKEKELIPSECIYAYGDTAPKLVIDNPQLVYKGLVHTPYLSNSVQVRIGDPVTAKATISNETGNGMPYRTLLLVGYSVGDKIAVLARSEAVILRDGETQDFTTSFTMGDKRWDVLLVSIYYTGPDQPGCPIEMSAPIYVIPKPQEPGQPSWKYVSEPYWVDQGTVRIDYEMGSPRTEQWGDSFRYMYTPYLELNGTPAIRGMPLSSGNTTGTFKILKSRLDSLGYMATLTLKETDQKEDEEVEIDEVRREVHPQGNKFIITTPRDDNISVVEIVRVPLFGFNMVNPTSLLLNIVLECTAPPCTFELTEADGLEEGKEYAFISSHSINPGILAMINVPNESIYTFEGVQNIEVEPIIEIIAETFCTLLGIDPKSTDCLNEILTLADPLYVADAISRTVYNTNLVGNEAHPDALDIPFVALALATGAVPAGGAGKKLFGKILKGARNPLTRELNDVGLWIERHMDLISASILRGFKSDVELAVKRIASAADAIPGSPEQDALLKQAKDLMEETIKGTDYKTAVTRSEAWVDRITDQLGIAGSKTPPKEVISKGKVKDGIKHIPGVVSKNPADVSDLERVIHGNKLYIKHEGVWLKLEEVLIKDGKITQKFRPRPKGLFGLIKSHPISASLISGVAFCGCWYALDNVQFIIYILRTAKILDDLWGDQWDEYSRNCKDVHFLLKDDPCDHTYQRDYLLSLTRLDSLIEGAEPIPTGKIDQAKYLFNVLYGRDIGDPNEYLLESCKTKFDTWNHLYYELTLGCTAPLEPTWGFEGIEFQKLRFNVKVEKILDGDTINVSCTDEAWPFPEDETVRILGYDTPDKDTAGSTILGYSVRRKDIPEKGAPEDPTTPVLKADYYAPTTFIHDLLNKQRVWLEIDPNNYLGSHGRLLATIEVDHNDYSGDLGEEMLRKGYAMVFFYTPNGLMDAETREKYVAAETIARNAK